MKFSPVLLSVVMVIAVLCAEYTDITFMIAIPSVLFMAFVIRSVVFRKIDLAVLVLLIGFCVSFASHTFFTGEHNHRTTEYINRYVTLEGTVLTQAQPSRYGEGYRYILRVRNVKTSKTEENIKDTVLLTTDKHIRCGEKVTLSGIVKDMPQEMNENGFNMARHYKSQNVYTRIYSEEIVNEGKSRVVSPYIITGKFREAVDRVINQYYYGDSAEILSAVLTGDTKGFSDSYTKSVERTGFSRLFHPAYIHIMMISFFIGLFSTIVHKRIRDIVIIAVFLLYAVFNCAQIGFVRCFVAAAMTVIFKRRFGSSYYPDIMAYICIICSVLCPVLFLNAGFVMSVTAGMLMWAFMPYVSKWYRVFPDFIEKTLTAMTVCALFYTPLSSVYFNGLCIYSFLMPFIMTPVVVLMLILAPVVFIGLSVFGTVPVFKSYLDLMIWIVMKLPDKISELPYSYISIKSPSPSGLLAVICVIFGVYYVFRNEKVKRNIAFFLSSAFAASVVIMAIGDIGEMYFTFVNVGQGDGAVIHRTMGETVIIDGGGGNEYSEYNPGESVFVPYLCSKGYGNIDCAFVSHLHKDHIQGVIAAIEMLDVENLFISPPEKDSEDDMEIWRSEIETVAAENGTKVNYLYGGERIRFKSGLIIDVYPQNEVIEFSKDGNDSSLLMKATYGENSVLYTGDMTGYCEKQYINSGSDLSADILKVAHHGSNTSTTKEWLENIDAEYAVISCGENNSYNHPSKAVLDRLNGCSVLRTDINGTITFIADKKGIKNIRTLR